MELISEEDRRLLSAYHRTVDDEKVDIDLTVELIHQIHSGSETGMIFRQKKYYGIVVTIR